MPPPGKPTVDRDNQRPLGRDPDDDVDEPSNNLWVGNLPPDTAEPELTALFAKHGELDSVSTYAARNYAFVHFKRPEDAEAAKGALQGTLVRGNPIKIEFARPVCFPNACCLIRVSFRDHNLYRTADFGMSSERGTPFLISCVDLLFCFPFEYRLATALGTRNKSARRE